MSNLLVKKIDNNLSQQCPDIEFQEIEYNVQEIYQHVQDYLKTDVPVINPQFVSQNSFSKIIKELADDVNKFRNNDDHNSSSLDKQLSFTEKLTNKHSFLEKPFQKTGQQLTILNDHKNQTIISALANLMSKNVLGLCSQLYYQRSPIELFIVNENVIRINNKLELNQEKFIKWILTHEITHVVQMTVNDNFYNFIRQQIISLNSSLPEHKDKKKIIESTVAAMTFIEGMADHVMDVPGIIDDKDIQSMRTKIDFRRNNPPFYLGLLLKIITNNKNQQYLKGKVFADQVVSACGSQALMLPLKDTSFLPDQKEIDNPQLWIDRCQNSI
jgi:uncharacterized protein (DUF2342 family)